MADQKRGWRRVIGSRWVPVVCVLGFIFNSPWSIPEGIDRGQWWLRFFGGRYAMNPAAGHIVFGVLLTLLLLWIFIHAEAWYFKRWGGLESNGSFPSITLNKDDMSPLVRKGSAVFGQYIVIRKLRIANREKRPINVIVRLHLTGEGGKEATLNPNSVSPNIPWVGPNYLGEIIRVEPLNIVQGWIAYGVTYLERDGLGVRDDQHGWCQAVFEIEDVHTGQTKQFPMYRNGVHLPPAGAVT